MRIEFFADSLLILLISSVIFIILSLVNRSKKITKSSTVDPQEPLTDDPAEK